MFSRAIRAPLTARISPMPTTAKTSVPARRIPRRRMRRSAHSGGSDRPPEPPDVGGASEVDPFTPDSVRALTAGTAPLRESAPGQQVHVELRQTVAALGSHHPVAMSAIAVQIARRRVATPDAVFEKRPRRLPFRDHPAT